MTKYIPLLLVSGCISLNDVPPPGTSYTGRMTRYLQDVPKQSAPVEIVFSGNAGTLNVTAPPIPELDFHDSIRGILTINSGLVVGYVFPLAMTLDSALITGETRSVRFNAGNDTIGGIIGGINGFSYHFTAKRK